MATASVQVLLDTDVANGNIGPAAGLLSAYLRDATCHWLVLACDYPFFDADEIRNLFEEYKYPLTCLQNEQGWAEPLLAIWSPAALAQLKDNVSHDITGPRHVTRQLEAHMVEPLQGRALFNTNTAQDWDTAKAMAATGKASVQSVPHQNVD